LEVYRNLENLLFFLNINIKEINYQKMGISTLHIDVFIKMAKTRLEATEKVNL